MTLVAVAPDKFCKGFDGTAETPVAYSVLPLRDALARSYATDAHAVTYVIDGSAEQPRLTKAGLPILGMAVSVHCLFCDVDNPGHSAWTDELRYEAREREAKLDILQTVGIYETAHGLRYVQPLEQPVPAAEAERYLATWLGELSASGVHVDAACKDWTRHYRLPNVVRDGVAYCSPFVDLERMRPVSIVPAAVEQPSPRTPTFDPARSTTERITRALAYAAATPPAVEGQHGDLATHTLCATLTRGFDLCDSDALLCLRDWNARCSPPWTDADLAKKVANARRSGTEPVGGRLEERQQLVTPGKSVAEQRVAEREIAPVLKYEFQRGVDLLAEEITNPLWLVKGLLPESGVCVIAGEPKATKTWAALEIGMALATATPAFGEYEVTVRRNVAVFLAEDGKRSVKARIAALADSRHMPQSDAVANMHIICRGHIDILRTEDLQALVDSCRSIPDLGLLVMDPLRDLHSAEENDSTAMAKVTHALRWLRDQIKCSILFVHHASKSSKETSDRRAGQKMRGSSVIHGAIDAGFYMSDTKTDLQTFWTNRVQVEIKEGAGAGMFSLTLNLDNDGDGRATGGSWSVEHVESKEGSERARQLRGDVVACLQEAGAPIGIRKVREALKQRTGKGASDSVISIVLSELREDRIAVDTGSGWQISPTRNQALNPSTKGQKKEGRSGWVKNTQSANSGSTHPFASVDGSSVQNNRVNESPANPSTTHPLPIHVDGQGAYPSTHPRKLVERVGVDGCPSSGAAFLSKEERQRLLALPGNPEELPAPIRAAIAEMNAEDDARETAMDKARREGDAIRAVVTAASGQSDSAPLDTEEDGR